MSCSIDESGSASLIDKTNQLPPQTNNTPNTTSTAVVVNSNSNSNNLVPIVTLIPKVFALTPSNGDASNQQQQVNGLNGQQVNGVGASASATSSSSSASSSQDTGNQNGHTILFPLQNAQPQ
jgi:hypothetical protein